MSLILKNIGKTYERKMIFSDFSYEFDEKGLFVILGDSGIGKTTLLRIISGIDKKFEGRVLRTKNEKVSVSFQEYRLFEELTAIDNITEVSFEKKSGQAEEAAAQVLRRLKFKDEDMYLYPSSLSGGMKQRVSVARAVMRNAEILLLDEPTKELDSSAANALLNLIYEESKKRLVIIVTHKIDELKDFDFKTITLK